MDISRWFDKRNETKRAGIASSVDLCRPKTRWQRRNGPGACYLNELVRLGAPKERQNKKKNTTAVAKLAGTGCNHQASEQLSLSRTRKNELIKRRVWICADEKLGRESKPKATRYCCPDLGISSSLGLMALILPTF